MSEKIDKVWFKVKNMMGYELEWEWMSEDKNGSFVQREDVLKIINDIKNLDNVT